MAVSSEFRDIIAKIRCCHEKAVSSYKNAIGHEENGDQTAAISEYLTALRCSEEGLTHNVFDHEQSGESWEEIREMQERMIIIQGHTKQRIYELQSNTTIDNSSHQGIGLPPAYSVEDRMGDTTPSSPNFECDANTILFIEYGVQLYFVSSEDLVGTLPPRYPTSLAVLQLSHQTNGGPEVIIQVGEKLYPLMKDQMPVYKSRNGVYMFPNCNEAGIVEGSFGVVIPQTVSTEVKQRFEDILQQYGAYRCDDMPDPDYEFVDLSEFIETTTNEYDYVPPSLSQRISASVLSGATLISKRLQRGTCYATDAVETHAVEMICRTTPSKSELNVHPSIKKGLEYTNAAAKQTVRIKNWLVDWLQRITVAVGHQLRPHLSKAVDSTSGTTKSGFDGAYSIVNAGLTGFAKIWSELESSASKITKAVTSAMVKNVEYKYGQDAGEAVGLAVGAFVSIGETAFTLDNIGAKVIADLGNNCLDGKCLENVTSEDQSSGENEDSCTEIHRENGRIDPEEQVNESNDTEVCLQNDSTIHNSHPETKENLEH